MMPDAVSREWLAVGDGHRLHLARYGNPNGKPVLWLHGGPGSGCLPSDISLWDLSVWQVIMLDQRGAGLSTPSGCVCDNDFDTLLADIERVRGHLGVDRWYIAGGSFGATLGLLYAGQFPGRVVHALLWGVFIPSAAGVNWLYGEHGAALLFPDAYHRFSGKLQPRLSELLASFGRDLHGNDAERRDAALRRWISWEAELSMPGNQLHWESTRRTLAMAAIQLHYAIHHYFDGLSRWQSMLGNLAVRCDILQGENDWVCPATLLKRGLQPFPANLTLRVVPASHHSLADPRMFAAVKMAIEQMAGAGRCDPL
ncbi:alpha/beta fold hydrolase [Shewanella sp. GXUN23E]|uniref:alpha/beta fold hydrolase n=1 Tax=Shewanella sp. GXUN23E TaxID=3422498 RepID=UPI003D7E429D